MVNSIILWLVFLGIFLCFVGISVLIQKQNSPIHQVFYERESIYNYAYKIGPLVSTYIPTGKRMELSNQLMYANYPLGLRTEGFIGLQVIIVLICIVVGLILTSFGIPSLLILLLAGIGYFLPKVLLNEKVEKRQGSIRKDLPNMVDLLSTSVKAGVELGTAFEKISMSIPNTLGEELRATMKEIATGSQRSIAFRRMSERLGVDILDRFIETINTAEERGGMNISQVLEDFIEDIRVMKDLEMEEDARKLPTKMLLPIFTCVFIPMLVILLTPVVFTLTDIV